MPRYSGKTSAIRILALCCIGISATGISSCGKAIANLQKFSPNHPPVISSFTETNTDGTAVDRTKIATRCVYLLTVTASDPDNHALVYTFRSAYGTFRYQTATAGSCTVQFVMGVVKADDRVTVSVSVSDTHNAITGTTLDVGTGKLGPAISAAPSATAITSKGDLNLTVTSNCAGSFQIVPGAAGAAPSAPTDLDPGQYVISYISSDNSVSTLVTGPASKTAGNAQFPFAAAYTNTTTYTVWIIFKDSLKQIDAVSFQIRVDDEAPKVLSTTPSSGAKGVPTAPTISITFNEAMNPASITSDILKVVPLSAAAAGAVSVLSCDDASHTASFSVTGLDNLTEYTATVAGARDTAGNTLSPSVFIFTTVYSADILVTGMTITPGSATLYKNSTYQLSAKFTPSNAMQAVTWASNNPSVTVDSGTITAVSAGQATITATTADGRFSASCSCTVSDTSASSAFDHTSGTITGYTGPVPDVIIPSSIDGTKITSIDISAFQNRTTLTSFTIPSSVTEIGDNAFQGCSGLTSISIPSSITVLNMSVFVGCTSLTSVTIPSSVTTIGKYAFMSCTGLESITIPPSVTTIEYSAFQSCTKLESITIPPSVTSIGNSAFYNCTGLTSVTVLATVPPTLGTNVFYGTSSILPGLTIKVPSAALSAYQAAANWSVYSAQMEEY